jgi:predicted nucleic acid-binding protein
MSKPVYCWDTCVFIAWLKQEENKPLADIELVVNEIDSGHAVLVVSVTVFTEIQRSKFTNEQWERFQGFLTRSNVVVANTTPDIAQKGSEIRDRAEADERRIKTGDATIVATAIAYGVDALHTFDPGLLRLSRSAVVEGLPITEPITREGQKGLRFGDSEE